MAPDPKTTPALRTEAPPPLAVGLTRLALAALCAVVLLGIGGAFVLVEVRGTVARMSAVDALDDSRDQVFSALADRAVDIAKQADAGQIARGLDHLSEDLDALLALDPGNDLPGQAVVAVERVRTLVAQADLARQDAADFFEALRGALEEAYAQHASWKQLVDARQADAVSRGRVAEARQRALNATQAELMSAILVAANIQREIDAVSRYNATEAGREVPLDRIIVSANTIPPVCAADEVEAPGRICSPTPARVHRALRNLETADDTPLPKRIEAAQWALEAYVRSGEFRYRELLSDLDDALDMAAAARRDIDKASINLGSLSRMLRVVRQMDEMLNRLAVETAVDPVAADRLMASVLTQIRLRGSGTGVAIGAEADAIQSIEALTDRMATIWQSALEALKERQRLEAALGEALSGIDANLARLEDETRDAAALWVGLITTAAFGSLAILLAMAVGAIWGGRTLIAQPLAQTTSTILALSRDEHIPPVRLSRRRFGFDMLETALDTLRLANIERAELTRKTVEQREEIARNLAALAQTTQEMEYQARHDALTGLPNRRSVDDILGGLQADGKDFTILHVDVDRFKEINDTLGHEAGDTVLRHVAQLLRAFCHETDSAFRIGGDEFLVLRRGAVPDEDTSQLTARIIAAMNEPIDFEGHACRIGASIGIAHGRDAGFDGRQTLVNADIALYEAKSGGRNRAVYFAAPLQEKTINRKRLADRLAIAVENEEFVPYYQPQFYSGSLALRGLETLCRWQHPEHGIVPPGAFLAQAEESCLLGKIDQILLRKAARDLDMFTAKGCPIPKISFNVTADRLMHTDFADVLMQQVGPDTRIAVELLESMSLDSLSESVRWAIDTLKERGVGIEIDDFGSCRASIAGLIAVSPDAMKIDGSIVAPITTSRQHLRLVEAIVDIGKALGIEVVAERVETDEHVRILGEMGAMVLQGYALAKPMSATELLAFLTARRAADRHAS